MRLVSFLCLIIFIVAGCSCSSKDGKKIKRSNSFDRGHTEEAKKLKRFDYTTVDLIRLMIEADNQNIYIQYFQAYGPMIMCPKETDLLKFVIDNGKIGALESFFKNVTGDTFSILMDVLSLTAPQRQDIIKAVFKPEFIKTYDNENFILNHLLTRKDEITLKTLLKNGIQFKNWRGKCGSNLTHIVVQKNWTSLVPHVFGFDLKDKSGLTPIFYASTPEMVKLIRFYKPGARDHVNKKVKAAWQKAFDLKNKELLDAFISPQRRLKKFRAKQMDYYDIPWVKSASLLKVDRAFLLWSTFKEVNKVVWKWYKPSHKFFIKFKGENGLDGGGLKNEWITDLLQSFFVSKPKQDETSLIAPIFIKVDEENSFYAPNKTHKPEVFKFVGSIVGIALAMNIPIKQKLIPAIYRALMHEELDLINDLQEQSLTVFTNIHSLATDPTLKMSDMFLTLPSNPNVYVTRRNLPRYIREYSRDCLHDRYESEISAFVEGFELVLPVKVYEYFTFEEFKKILTGKPADYNEEEFVAILSCTSETHKALLKRFVREASAVQRGLLLKFITGLNALPADGFDGLNSKITVEIDPSLVGKLPTSSTCSFLLKVPPFTNYEIFSSALTTAIEWTATTDNEAGLRDDEGISLVFDSESESENINVTNDSESEVSDISDSDSESDNYSKSDISLSISANVSNNLTINRSRSTRGGVNFMPDF